MVNSPDYIAFRAPNGLGLLTFVAALVPGERGSFPWAKWYSESAPNGEFRKVPGGYVRFAVTDAVAVTMIDTIRQGALSPMICSSNCQLPNLGDLPQRHSSKRSNSEASIGLTRYCSIPDLRARSRASDWP